MIQGMALATFPKNVDVREQMTYRVNGLTRAIPLWVVAAELEIHENTLRSWLRKEMEAERKQKVLSAIHQVRSELEYHRVTTIHPPER